MRLSTPVCLVLRPRVLPTERLDPTTTAAAAAVVVAVAAVK